MVRQPHWSSFRIRLLQSYISTLWLPYRRHIYRHWFSLVALQWRHNGRDGVSITSLTVVCSIIYSGADQRKHQSSTSLPFVWGIRRSPVNSPHTGPVTRKMIPFDDVIMSYRDKTRTRLGGKKQGKEERSDPLCWPGLYDYHILFAASLCAASLMIWKKKGSTDSNRVIMAINMTPWDR